MSNGSIASGRMVEIGPGIHVWTEEPESDAERERREARETARAVSEARRDAEFRALVENCGAMVCSVDDGRGSYLVATWTLRNGYTMTASRRWAYLSVRIAPELSAHADGAGYRINHSRYVSRRPTKYSGSAAMLGSVCRADGFAGGLFGDDFLRYFGGRGLSFWHVDDVSALPTLIRRIAHEPSMTSRRRTRVVLRKVARGAATSNDYAWLRAAGAGSYWTTGETT